MKILHKIEVKLLLLVLFILAVFSTIFFILQDKEKDEMEFLTKDSERNLELNIQRTVKLNGKSLETMVFDYTYWDEMVEFVRTKSPKWALENIETGTDTYGANAAWVFDTNFEQLYTYAKNRQNDILELGISQVEWQKIFNQSWFPHFFVQTKRGPLELRGAPIQPSSDRNRVTKPQGYFVSAKLWDTEYINTLAEHSESNIDLVDPVVFKELQKIPYAKNEFILHSKYNLNSHDGKIIAILHVSKHSEMISVLEYSTYRKFIILLFNAIILIVVISSVLFFQVVKPISAISKSLSFSDPTELNDVGKSKSEFGSFAKLIQEFFKQKEELQNEIVIRKQAQHDLEILNNDLEQRVKDRTLDLKKERDQAKQYLDIAGSIIAILDKDGNVVLMNKKGLEILGYSNDKLIGYNWFRTCYDFNSREKRLEHYLDMVRKGQDIQESFIDEVITSSSQKKVLMFQNTLMKDENDNCLGVLFSAQDITELKQKEKELIASKEKAEESNRLKSSFLANMSHELRTPMIGILGYSELLLSEAKDADTREMLQSVYDSSTRLLNTLNLILNLSRLESNKQEVNLQTVNINSLLQIIHTDFAGAARTQNLSFNCKLPRKEINAIVDLKLLTDVMNNLVNNALKFTSEGFIELELKPYESTYKIIVRDSGIGIKKENLRIIFDEFRQASEGLGRKFQGTGLGLTISKKYIELLGGNIEVISEEGHGSEFIVELPLKIIPSDTFNEASEVSNAAHYQPMVKVNEKANSDLKKILIVEDEVSTRDLIKLYLKNDYTVFCAANAEEALNLINDQEFDLILTDINLGPGKNGLELSQTIKSRMNGNNIPIVASTAFAMRGDKEEILSAGCDYYISKPYTRLELLKLLDEIFEAKEA